MEVKKYLFAIFAVTAMLAFIGVGSASATVLCSEAATACTSYGKGAAVDASLTETTTFSTTGGTVLDTCTSGVIEGSASNSGSSSETVRETIEELTWGSCTSTADTTNKGELEIHWISGGHNGTVTGKSINVTLNTSFGSCTYGTGTALDLGTLTGGNPAAIDINTILAKQAGGFLCPAEAKWAASYSVTSPQPLFIGESAIAAAPTIVVKNTGGVQKPNTNRCEFALRLERCKITVENLSQTEDLVVLGVEIAGEKGASRYGIAKSECSELAKIPAGKSCTDEVVALVNPLVGWSNWYCIEVEGVGHILGNAQLNPA
ncbi:MAG: hypothetical protein ACTHNP_09740 [Solirubrobacterales bacterium]